MGTFWKAFAGKVAGTLFIAVCLALGFGPDKWAAFVIQGLPLWFTPQVARILFICLAIATIVSMIWPVVVSLPRKQATASATSKRMPLRDLYKQAKRSGWDFADITGHVFDISDGLRQAGADGQIQFSGTRIHRIPALTEDGFLQDIRKEYWETCKISAISPFELDPRGGHVIGIKDDNSKTETYNPWSGYDVENYQDIHVDREQALEWLRKESMQYMGRNKAELNR